MNSVKLSVPDISCDHCKTSIEGAVSVLNGVARVEVSVPDKTVEVEFDEGVDQDTITATIEDQGYTVA